MAVVFDAEVLSREERIPEQFVWPAEERPAGGGDGDGGVEEMDIPVVGHGVGAALIAEAYRCCDAFYARPLAEKQRARRRPGESHGYASSFTGRFDACLPWKETLSFHCPAPPAPGSGRAVADYFVGVLGEEYRHMGYVR
ncbi:gibberellin 20 oxidase 1-B-like [Panicum miliaceum]|uniref:Gibberellin 20 oxidase 1-B-like n=1 Tax=Panicum miliaceum TaxID=4540 RepID=A0A3L6QSC2_PANMI|nr:gibberellin 20 oxidase 1-B-like [Panicum miliaceum]